jgi:hypothetical protein
MHRIIDERIKREREAAELNYDSKLIIISVLSGCPLCFKKIDFIMDLLALLLHCKYS